MKRERGRGRDLNNEKVNYNYIRKSEDAWVEDLKMTE